MKRMPAYEHPTSYEAIVANQCERHEHRLRELKRSEKAIRAVSPDLSSLAKLGLHVDIGDYSLYLIDHRRRFRTNGRSKSALYLATGYLNNTSDRFVEAFMSLGWIVEAINIDPVLGQVLLRRPRTETRIVLDVSEELAKSLGSQEVK
jgi:hypothetical protein